MTLRIRYPRRLNTLLSDTNFLIKRKNRPTSKQLLYIIQDKVHELVITLQGAHDYT